jgi:plasmid maintenance system killer protein
MRFTSCVVVFHHCNSPLRLACAQFRANDLVVPLGNPLEKVAGARTGQYSIRVNDQYRICFTSDASGAGNIELVDEH